MTGPSGDTPETIEEAAIRVGLRLLDQREQEEGSGYLLLVPYGPDFELIWTAAREMVATLADAGRVIEVVSVEVVGVGVQLWLRDVTPPA